MTDKFIHWIKENGMIIVGILLGGYIIYIYFSDKYYFYNSENVRYTIAKYKDTDFRIGRSPKTQYDFWVEGNGKIYNIYTYHSKRLHLKAAGYTHIMAACLFLATNHYDGFPSGFSSARSFRRSSLACFFALAFSSSSLRICFSGLTVSGRSFLKRLK